MIYQNEYTREISFPVGGIGTGCFGIAGNGRFVDWEILNRPNKGSCWQMSHIAVKAQRKNGDSIVKVLNGDLIKDLTGTYQKNIFKGFGFGPETGTMCGISHFRNCVFEGTFPIAKLTFTDNDFPADVIMTVFNPLIPLDSFNSSIPAGFFELEFHNKSEEKIEYTAVFSMRNPFEKTQNFIVKKDGYNVLKLTTEIAQDDINYGDLCVVTDSNNYEIQQYWYRGMGMDHLDVFMKELTFEPQFKNRIYETCGNGDIGSVASHISVLGGEKGNLRFVLSWNAPNQSRYWDDKSDGIWKNYYATVFESSVESAVYSIKNFESLYVRTIQFKETLFGSSLDESVLDAISSTLSVLKSPIIQRLEDGSFYGWEGVHELEGSCEGTCQHVWNYAYALCFLFPDLERSIRNNEFKYSTTEEGETFFRMFLPIEKKKIVERACLDGQMGCIIKTYREWKISGDTEWLKSVWPKVKKILSYAWNENNEDRWDYNKDGVLEGRQHHTLDMELYGPSAWLEGFYLGALKAAAQMAEFLGDHEAFKEYSELFEKGYQWTKEHLFNGEYFNQIVNLKDKSILEQYDNTEMYWYDETGELKYQIGDGCEIDQLCGQWHANICGLGRLFDKEQTGTALQSLYRYNYKKSMRNVNNTWRVFSLNDEGGAIICSYPKEKPTIPIQYHSETMTGFEYALAGLMVSEGFEKEGLEIVKSIRDRYDGKKRNPWNEIECGSNYARSMASFALLPIYSGFYFDLPNKTIGFSPVSKDNFKCLFSVGTAWGEFSWTEREIRVEIKEGSLELQHFLVEANVQTLRVDEKEIEYEYDGKEISFSAININKNLVVSIFK